MKTFIRIILTLFIIATVVLIVISVYQKEWNTVTAEIALIIAIISGWITYETFREAQERKKPFITIFPDYSSRYDLLQLRMRNNGEHPAYNVKIEWDRPIVNHKGEQARFNKYSNDIEAVILNGNEETSVLIDTPGKFYETHKESGLNFKGTITYSLKSDSKSTIEKTFEVSFEHRGASLSYEEENVRTSFELQKIPKQLDGIRKTIERLTPELDEKGTDKSKK